VGPENGPCLFRVQHSADDPSDRICDTPSEPAVGFPPLDTSHGLLVAVGENDAAAVDYALHVAPKSSFPINAVFLEVCVKHCRTQFFRWGLERCSDRSSVWCGRHAANNSDTEMLDLLCQHHFPFDAGAYAAADFRRNTEAGRTFWNKVIALWGPTPRS